MLHLQLLSLQRQWASPAIIKAVVFAAEHRFTALTAAYSECPCTAATSTILLQCAVETPHCRGGPFEVCGGVAFGVDGVHPLFTSDGIVHSNTKSTALI